MKRGICLLVLFVFAAPALAPVGAAAEDPLASVLKQGGYTVSLDLRVRKKKRDSLERVVSDLLGDNGPNAYATGFVVGDGLVMTAYHVVSGGLSADKRRQLGFTMDDQLVVEASVKGCVAKVLKIDPDSDLALLGVCGSRKPSVTLAFQEAPATGRGVARHRPPRTAPRPSGAAASKARTSTAARNTGRPRSRGATASPAAPSTTRRGSSSASSAATTTHARSRSSAPARAHRNSCRTTPHTSSSNPAANGSD